MGDSVAADNSYLRTSASDASALPAGPEQVASDLPNRNALEHELRRERRRNGLFSSLATTALAFAAIVSGIVLLAILVFPVLRVSGHSMSDTLNDGDVVVSLRPAGFATGDLVAFNYNNGVVAKRVIATGGQWVDIDRDGFVYVDGARLEEPYVSDRARGECSVELPYQVPDGRLFVMGDHRSSSVDSRSSSFGCITDDQLVGKLMWCAWPPGHVGPVG